MSTIVVKGDKLKDIPLSKCIGVPLLDINLYIGTTQKTTKVLCY